MHRSLLLAVVTLLLAVSPGTAQESSAHKKVAEKAISELRSPYCPGLMLEVCPSQPAEALRDSIRDQARAGMDADGIVEWVLARHGEEWRAVPKRRGFGFWAWALPPIALAIGGVVMLSRLRSMQSSTADEPAPRSLTTGEQDVIQQALRDLERNDP